MCIRDRSMSSPGAIAPESRLAELPMPAADIEGVLGTPEQKLKLLTRFLGLGAPVTKSALLSFVSVHPLECRSIAVTLFGEGAGDPSAAFAFPYPTKSTICGPVGALPD